jgi:hypothetical protein
MDTGAVADCMRTGMIRAELSRSTVRALESLSGAVTAMGAEPVPLRAW